MSRRKHREDGDVSDPRNDGLLTPPNSTDGRSTPPEPSFHQRYCEGIGPNLGHLGRSHNTATSRSMAEALHVASRSDRVRLYPGTKGFRQDFQILCPREAALECRISFENTIAAFLAAELKPLDALCHLVVLTGKKHKMWSTTCEEYVSRTWPEVSDQVISLYELIGRPQATKIDNFINLGAGKSPNLIRVKLKTKSMSNPTDKGHLLQVTLEARREPLLDMIEAVAWLFATAYNAQDLVLRGVRLELQSAPSFLNFDLRCDRMKSVTEVSKEWSSICWMPLMRRYPIAVDFETPARDLKIKGMEVSFHLMCFLCGLEYAVEEEGGLVLYGQKSVVWPTQASDDCVEWHFQRCEDTFEGRDEKPLEKTRSCMSIDHLESWSAQKRHFLGLWADPVVTLGTSISDASEVAYSQAEEARYSYRRHGRQIGGTIACPKTFSLTWTEIYTVAENRRNVYMDNFESKVHARRNTPVMLYSVSEKRAWIVSFLSVLWHLARARSEYQKVLGFHIPPCAQSADGGQAAFDKIFDYYRQPLKRRRPNERVSVREQNLTIKDYLNEVWAALDCATRETNRARRVWGSTIYGYEMADIAFLKPDLYMKEHRLDFRYGWTPLVDEVRLVLFYEGLPDPIQSNGDHLRSTICSNTIWPKIPTGYNLLTVSLPCLIDMAQRFGPSLNRLTSTHQWHSPTRGQLFGPCDSAAEHTCDRLQEVRRIAHGRGAPPDPPPRNFSGDQRGAVVFKYTTGMGKIQRNLNASRTVYPPPPLPAQVALETGYPNGHVRSVYEPPVAGLDRSQANPIPAPVRRPPPTRLHIYNARTTYLSDSGYSTVSLSPAIGSFNVNNQVADDATEMPSTNARDGFRRSDSRRRSSQLDRQEQNQQSRPSITRTQQHGDDERGRRDKHRKRTRQRHYQNKPRTPSPRRCLVM